MNSILLCLLDYSQNLLNVCKTQSDPLFIVFSVLENFPFEPPCNFLRGILVQDRMLFMITVNKLLSKNSIWEIGQKSFPRQSNNNKFR